MTDIVDIDDIKMALKDCCLGAYLAPAEDYSTRIVVRQGDIMDGKKCRIVRRVKAQTLLQLRTTIAN